MFYYMKKMRSLGAFCLFFLLASETATPISLTTKAGSALNRQITVCKDRMIDAVSVQDSSASLRRQQWEQVLRATTQLIDAIEVGPAKSHISVISFGSLAHINWDLDDEKAKNPVLAKSATLKLPHLSQNTNTPQALTLAHQVFQRVAVTDPDRYNNPHVTRVLVLSTDGCANVYNRKKFPNTKTHLEAAVESLRSLPNLIVLVVGIGTNLCVEEIRRIAGCLPASTGTPCPNAKFTDFDRLFEDIPKYLEEVCEQAEELEEQPTGPKGSYHGLPAEGNGDGRPDAESRDGEPDTMNGNGDKNQGRGDGNMEPDARNRSGDKEQNGGDGNMEPDTKNGNGDKEQGKGDGKEGPDTKNGNEDRERGGGDGNMEPDTINGNGDKEQGGREGNMEPDTGNSRKELDTGSGNTEPGAGSGDRKRGGDNRQHREEEEEEEKKEGGTSPGLIAGGVLGGLALLSGIAGTAYAYTRPGAGGGGGAGHGGDFGTDAQATEELLPDREEVLHTEASMYA